MKLEEDGMINRRQFGRKLAGLAGAAVVGAGGFAAVSQPQEAFATANPTNTVEAHLGANSAASATTLVLESPRDPLAAPLWVVVAPYTQHCELQRATAYDAVTATLTLVSALSFGHSTGDVVLLLPEPRISFVWFSQTSTTNGDYATDFNNALRYGNWLSSDWFK